MATESTQRSITVERVGAGRFAAVNQRGGKIVFGTGGDEDFTPTELLLIALGGCTAIDVDILTSRRAEPESFEIEVDADKVRDDGGNHLTNVEITYRISFPPGADGDKARAFNDIEPLVKAIAQAARPGDHVLVMSNGGFGGIHQKLLDALSGEPA